MDVISSTICVVWCRPAHLFHPVPISICPSCDPTGLTSLAELHNPDTALEAKPGDPYLDPVLLHFLLEGVFPDDDLLTSAEHRDLRRKAQRYRLHPSVSSWI